MKSAAIYNTVAAWSSGDLEVSQLVLKEESTKPPLVFIGKDLCIYIYLSKSMRNMRNSLWIPQAAQAEAAKKKLQEQLAEDHRNDTCFGSGKWMELSCNGFTGFP